MLYLFFWIIIISLCVHSVKYFQRIVNPIFCLSFFIGASCFLSIEYSTYTRYLPIGILLLGVGCLLFSLGFYFAQSTNAISTEENYIYNEDFVRKSTSLCCLFKILSLCFSIYIVHKLCGDITLVFSNSTAIRQLYFERNVPLYLLLPALFMSCNTYLLLAMFPIAFQNKIKYTREKFILIVVISLLDSVFTMSKLAFFVFVIYVLSLFSITSGKEQEKSILLKYGKYFLTLIICLMAIIIEQRGYINSGRYNSFSEAIVYSISDYMIVPIEGFSYLTDTEYSNFTNGDLSFRPILNIISYIGIGSRNTSIQDTINGTRGNVYTMFGDFYIDFSYIGIFLLSLFYGFFLGKLYKKDSSKSLNNIAINSLITMFMAFAFYDFQFIQTIYLAVIIYILLFCKVFRNKIYIYQV